MGSCVALSSDSPASSAWLVRAWSSIWLSSSEVRSGRPRPARFHGQRRRAAAAGGPAVDPFHGFEDLAQGRLRAVAASNFDDDPLRALRAARFVATHALEPDAGTQRLCRRIAPRLSEVAPERVCDELAKLLGRRAPGRLWPGRRAAGCCRRPSGLPGRLRGVGSRDASDASMHPRSSGSRPRGGAARASHWPRSDWGWTPAKRPAGSATGAGAAQRRAPWRVWWGSSGGSRRLRGPEAGLALDPRGEAARAGGAGSAGRPRPAEPPPCRPPSPAPAPGAQGAGRARGGRARVAGSFARAGRRQAARGARDRGPRRPRSHSLHRPVIG